MSNASRFPKCDRRFQKQANKGGRYQDIMTDDPRSQLAAHLQVAIFFQRWGWENVNAFVDCLSGLRFPENRMAAINIKPDAYTWRNVNCLSDDLTCHALLATQVINEYGACGVTGDKGGFLRAAPRLVYMYWPGASGG